MSETRLIGVRWTVRVSVWSDVLGEMIYIGSVERIMWLTETEHARYLRKLKERE